jgi:hypothetical protein
MKSPAARARRSRERIAGKVLARPRRTVTRGKFGFVSGEDESGGVNRTDGGERGRVSGKGGKTSVVKSPKVLIREGISREPEKKRQRQTSKNPAGGGRDKTPPSLSL